MEDHTPHVVIWRGVIIIHVTGPYFFDGNVNGILYFETWENYVISDLTSGGIMKQVSLQQNCAPTHFNLTVLLNSFSNFPRIGRFFVIPSTNTKTLTLRLLMSYVYGAPSKARNANVVYIWTYVWQR